MTPAWRYVIQLVGVALAFSGASYFPPGPFGYHFNPNQAASLWPAGLATGALLGLGARVWPSIAVTAFLLSLGDRPNGVVSALVTASGQTAGSLTCWWLVNRYAYGLTTFPRVDAVVRFAACVLASAAVSALFGVISLHLSLVPAVGPNDWFLSVLRESAGIVLVAPVITLWFTGAPWRWQSRRAFEFAAVLACTGVTGWFLFGPAAGDNPYPIQFVVLPVLLWPAFRLGVRETVATTLLLSVIAITGTAWGYGPFASYSFSNSIYLVQAFVGVCALGALAVSAEVGRREAIETEARALNEDLERRVSERARELVRAHETLRRTRLKHVAAMRLVHARIAADLHDSVGASLSRIAILSDVALRESEASTTATTGALTKIGDNARAAIDEMTDAVWLVDPRVEDVQQMVVRLRTIAADLFEADGIAWEIDAGLETQSWTLTPDQRRHLFLLLKEALTNMHRHAHATVVRVALSATNSGLRAVIDDNGTGVLQERAGPCLGNGMANMQKRARELAGTLSIQSRPVIAGTRIVVDVPLRH